tara:strand:- start:715 stop:1638 length:924 start_codon:yes stop_codon:yes gene_type:complete
VFKYLSLYLIIGGTFFFGRQFLFEDNKLKEKVFISKEKFLELKNKSYISDSKVDAVLFKRLIEEEITNEILFKEAINLKINESDLLVRNWLVRNMKFLLKRENEATKEKMSDEKYFKQALSLGIDRKDQVVKRILVNRMKDILSYKRGILSPSVKEIKNYQMKHVKDFSHPPLYEFEQIFYKSSKKAQYNLEFLKKEGRIHSHSSPFHLGKKNSLSKIEINKSFGKLFYENMKGIAEKNVWVGPITSNFGYHLIKLKDIKTGKLHNFERVKDKIELLIIEEKKKTVLNEEIDKLFKKYEIVLPLEEV